MSSLCVFLSRPFTVYSTCCSGKHSTLPGGRIKKPSGYRDYSIFSPLPLLHLPPSPPPASPPPPPLLPPPPPPAFLLLPVFILSLCLLTSAATSSSSLFSFLAPIYFHDHSIAHAFLTLISFISPLRYDPPLLIKRDGESVRFPAGAFAKWHRKCSPDMTLTVAGTQRQRSSSSSSSIV